MKDVRLVRAGTEQKLEKSDEKKKETEGRRKKQRQNIEKIQNIFT